MEAEVAACSYLKWNESLIFIAISFNFGIVTEKMARKQLQATSDFFFYLMEEKKNLFCQFTATTFQEKEIIFRKALLYLTLPL